MRPVLLPVLLFGLPSLAHAQFIVTPSPRNDPMPGIADHGTMTPSPPIGHEIGELRDRIRDGRKSGELTKREAKGLKREADMIGTLSERYAADGLSDSEQRELEMRIEVQRATTARQRLLNDDQHP
ncbi:MAG TPA: hypothetical protein VHO04_06675 [Sphingopyxis sp.]|jgi:hypothetical protein|uniref:hypothetical protein n=1 Tax=Sphingopyxis sp. TaxID=1908224 RepID=UPI002E30A0E1|nr:hypothetical protein [Sphingopyxis sp.]HEX2812350.1 hypothetical protein [Sphingopyxis sp.]